MPLCKKKAIRLLAKWKDQFEMRISGGTGRKRLATTRCIVPPEVSGLTFPPKIQMQSQFEYVSETGAFMVKFACKLDSPLRNAIRQSALISKANQRSLSLKIGARMGVNVTCTFYA
ncbi:hypothetical protein M514_07457, partial [Trichuris suis]